MAGVRLQGTAARTAALRTVGDERRDLLRMDDCLLMECLGEPAAVEGGAPSVEAAVSAFMGGPMPELLTRAAAGGAEAWLLPWMMKLDWAVEVMLRGLARINPDAVRLPSTCDVNLSGSGLRFRSTRPFRQGEAVALRLVLPPFVPVSAQGEVVRSAASKGEPGRYDVAVKFSAIAADDRERIIRHIVQRQAEVLRARRNRE